MIKKVFSHYSIPAHCSIRNTFKCKLWETLSSLGGMKRKQTLSNWREGKLSIWSFTVDTKEVQQQLLKRSHQVEVQLKREQVKRQKLEVGTKHIKCEVILLKKNQVEQANLRAGRPDSSRSTCRDWQSYSQQHQAIREGSWPQIVNRLLLCEKTPFSRSLCYLLTKTLEIRKYLMLPLGLFLPMSNRVGILIKLNLHCMLKISFHFLTKPTMSLPYFQVTYQDRISSRIPSTVFLPYMVALLGCRNRGIAC